MFVIDSIRHKKTTPPGGNDDDDDDGATEVQTKFVCSQYFTTITTKSKINNTISSGCNSSKEKMNSSNIILIHEFRNTLPFVSSIHNNTKCLLPHYPVSCCVVSCRAVRR